MKLWQRYLLKKIVGTFSFLLLCLFVGYVLIDLSIHGVKFFSRGDALTLLKYYVYQFAVHLELFVPLTFLLTTLKVLFDLGGHLELVALQSGTLSTKRLLLPFFAVAVALTSLCYANSEWFAPNAIFTTRTMKPKKTHTSLHMLALEDRSELVYQRFDPAKKELFDVFWVRSSNDIWHMKTLSLASWPPTGFGADHLVRTKLVEKTESFEERTFAEIPLKTEAPFAPFIPPENRPLSTLWKQRGTKQAKSASIASHMHAKLAMPLLPVLTLVAIAPFGVRFSRKRFPLIMTALSLFAFVTWTTLFESFLILGENQVLPAVVALWTPVWFILVLALPRFLKL